MKYLGSKQRIAKYIVPIIQQTIDETHANIFIEPFCGGCNLIDKIHCNHKIASDKDKYLIALLKYVQEHPDGQGLYESVSKELYDQGRAAYYKNDTSELKDWQIGNIIYLASFSGRGASGGYAKSTYEKNKNGLKLRDYYREAKDNLLKQASKQGFQEIDFMCADYSYFNNVKESLIYCFDKETEVLTSNGWKYFKDIDITSDLFLSREPNTHILEYVEASDYIFYLYNGEVYHYKSNKMDICVTNNHKIFCAKYIRNKESKKKKRVELFIPAQECFEKPGDKNFIRAGGIWNGTRLDTIKIADQEFDAIKFARLFGIFLTDGCVNIQGSITISQSKEGIKKIIEELLNDLKINYSIYKNNRKCTVYYIHRKYKDFFERFYLKENRFIPKEFKNAQKEVIFSLIEGILDGDSDTERRKIYIASKQLVDDIQECLYKIGLASNYTIKNPKKTYLKSEDRWIKAQKEYYVVSILKENYPSIKKCNINKEKYHDNVYCITLKKWHSILIRRNGKTVWMGQCDPPYQNVKQYEKFLKIDYDEFWNFIRHLSENNKVFISELSAPSDFEAIWSQDVLRSIKANDKTRAIEKLFIYKG